MSAVVDVWVGGFTKLKEKIESKSPPFLQLKSKSKSRRKQFPGADPDDLQEEQVSPRLTAVSKVTPSSPSSAAAVRLSPAMHYSSSEETIFWLMDRFAPC